jgi:bifunctional DNase/RNase
MDTGNRFAGAVLPFVHLTAVLVSGAYATETEAQTPPSDAVKTEVYDVRRDAYDQHVVRLHDPAGERFLRISIGPCEGQAILRKLKGYDFPRPLTHDLFHAVLEATRIRIISILVDELRPVDPGRNIATFFAILNLQHKDGQQVQVDSRPSDALALAVRMDIPVYVSRRILDENAVPDGEGLPPAKRSRKHPKSFY